MNINVKNRLQGTVNLIKPYYILVHVVVSLPFILQRHTFTGDKMQLVCLPATRAKTQMDGCGWRWAGRVFGYG